MPKFYVTVVAEFEIEAETAEAVEAYVKENATEPGTIFFAHGPIRTEPKEKQLALRIWLKERVKEVYAKLKYLPCQDNIHFYRDVLKIIMDRKERV